MDNPKILATLGTLAKHWPRTIRATVPQLWEHKTKKKKTKDKKKR